VLYGIEGDSNEDLRNGILDLHGSLVRNEAEVLRREEDKMLGIGPGAVNLPYSPEQPMSTIAASLDPVSKVSAATAGIPHGDIGQQGSGSSQRVPAALGSKNTMQSGAMKSPVVLSVTSPNAALGQLTDLFEPMDDQLRQYSRRNRMLTPITERLSEDTRPGEAHQLVENIPLRPVRSNSDPGSPDLVPQHASPRSSLGSRPPAELRANIDSVVDSMADAFREGVEAVRDKVESLVAPAMAAGMTR
jgi:hypothetical protein